MGVGAGVAAGVGVDSAGGVVDSDLDSDVGDESDLAGAPVDDA